LGSPGARRGFSGSSSGQPLPLSASEAEEQKYAAQRAGVRHAQATHQWLNDGLATLLQTHAPNATAALTAVLDFQPAPRCYGDAAKAADVDRVADALTRCGVHPAGWMLFEEDYLAAGDATNKRTLAEAAASDGDVSGGGGLAFSGGTELGGGGVAARERAKRAASAKRRAGDRRASAAIRRAVVPVCLLLLHEVHHANATWLLAAANAAANAASGGSSSGSGSSGGGGGGEEAAELRRAAASEFRAALQVADVAAARQHALYACLDGAALRQLLAACHSSAMQLLELTGSLEME
jgi:uncharacterized membrane protein YgcG